MAREKKLTPEEKALLRAQTAATGAQPGQAAAELMAKQRMAMDQLAAERTINAEKIGLGREEIGGRNQQSQLAAAIGLLDTGAKERIAGQGARETIASDLAKRGDIPQSVLATALAESGQPGLYNALQEEDARKKEAAIAQYMPGIRNAKSDVEREKNFKSTLETIAPGLYDTAVARAFPKPGQEAAGRVTPKRFETPTVTPASGGVDYSGLVNTLLGKSGVTSTATDAAPTADGPLTAAGIALGPARPYPTLPNTPEPRYVGLGHGSLEGSKIVPGGIETPSGGFIGGTLGADRLAKLITPRGGDMASTVNAINASRRGDMSSMTNANVNGATTQTPALNLPMTVQQPAPTVPLITQPTVPYEQLLASAAPGPRAPDVDIDKLLSGAVGQPSMEDLRRRQQFRY